MLPFLTIERFGMELSGCYNQPGDIPVHWNALAKHPAGTPLVFCQGEGQLPEVAGD